MTADKDAWAQRLLTEQAILNLLVERNKTTRGTAKTIFGRRDRINVPFDDDNDLGQVSVNKDKITTTVTDPDALLVWAVEHHPEWVDVENNVPIVQLTAALAHWAEGDETPQDMQVITSAAHSHLGTLVSNQSRTRIKPVELKRILDAVEKSGGLVDTETGEVDTTPAQWVKVDRQPGNLVVTLDPQVGALVAARLLTGLDLPEITTGDVDNGGTGR